MSIEFIFYMVCVAGTAYLIPAAAIQEVDDQARAAGRPRLAVYLAFTLLCLAWPVLVGAVLVEMWRDDS